jgi:hypothetical protein
MATNKKTQQITQSQYDEFRKGYAESLGFNPENLTAEQEHQVIEAMAADGIAAPSTKALPGSEVNPSNGNGAEIVTATKGKATNSKRNVASKGTTAGAGSRNSTIKQLVLNEVDQGREVGTLMAAGFAFGVDESYNANLDEFAAGILTRPSTAGKSIEDFLQTI